MAIQQRCCAVTSHASARKRRRRRSKSWRFKTLPSNGGFKPILAPPMSRRNFCFFSPDVSPCKCAWVQSNLCATHHTSHNRYTPHITRHTPHHTSHLTPHSTQQVYTTQHTSHSRYTPHHTHRTPHATHNTAGIHQVYTSVVCAGSAQRQNRAYASC